MSGSRPERVLVSVCGMTVDVAKAEKAGLTIEHAGRTLPTHSVLTGSTQCWPTPSSG